MMREEDMGLGKLVRVREGGGVLVFLDDFLKNSLGSIFIRARRFQRQR